MRIGIYTIHAVNNYGAMLQAYATQKFLQKNEFDAEIVNVFPHRSLQNIKYRFGWSSPKMVVKSVLAFISPKIRKKSNRFMDFHQSMNLSKRYFSSEEVFQNPPSYDIHLVGSDQVWNIERGFPQKSVYFLEFLKESQKRIAYAPSMGTSSISESLIPRLEKVLAPFSFIGVRERKTAELLAEITGKEVVNVVDPTFLLSAEEWMEETGKDPIVKGEYILYYGFSKREESREIIATLKELLRMPVVAITGNITLPYRVDTFCQDAGPREFINIFRNASYVITSSFHGTAFSLIFRRNFFVIRDNPRVERMESLLESFGIGGRIVSSKEELMSKYKDCPEIDYAEHENKMEKYISFSKEWLLTAIRRTNKVYE